MFFSSLYAAIQCGGDSLENSTQCTDTHRSEGKKNKHIFALIICFVGFIVFVVGAEPQTVKIEAYADAQRLT